MAGIRIPGDSRRLIADHRVLQEKLTELVIEADNTQMEVRDTVQALVEVQVHRVLAEVPVEELNREKRGIRVKTLRDQGYGSVEDLLRVSHRQLEEISGISDIGASEIQRMASDLYKQVRTGMKIRLSADDRTPEATALLRAIERYRIMQSASASAHALLTNHRRRIETAMQDLAAGQGILRRLFASREQKEQALRAYGLLRELLDGSYGTGARAAISRWERLQPGQSGDPWEAFRERPVEFYQVLDDLCPGILGNDDARYGLPEELAEEVQAEPVDLRGLRCRLRRYQTWGVRYILHQKRVLLGDEMGLGKTVQAIASMVALRNAGQTHFVVICPASVLENWCREVGKHSDLTVTKVHGADRESAFDRWRGSGGVAVTTYETTGLFRMEDSFRVGMAVVDEAHYIKNPEAQRTRHVRDLSGHADRLLFMTGTALENRVDEMISLISVLQPEVAEQIRGMASLSAAPQFREAIAPVYYRRKRDEVLTELPELIEKQEWCVLGPEEEAVYETAVLEEQFALARRVSWNVGNPARSCKARRMTELIEQAREQQRKILVFSFFLDTLRMVTELLGEQCLQPIDGSVSPGRRQEIVDEFDRAPAGTVLAAQIQAGGTGLNIQSASVVILCEPQLKPSTENQAISRAYRMGQTRNVLVYRLLCEDTVDERITSLLEQKQAAFDAFADESAAARETMELDRTALGQIMTAERQRIAGEKAI